MAIVPLSENAPGKVYYTYEKIAQLEGLLRFREEESSALRAATDETATRFSASVSHAEAEMQAMSSEMHDLEDEVARLRMGLASLRERLISTRADHAAEVAELTRHLAAVCEARDEAMRALDDAESDSDAKAVRQLGASPAAPDARQAGAGGCVARARGGRGGRGRSG